MGWTTINGFTNPQTDATANGVPNIGSQAGGTINYSPMTGDNWRNALLDLLQGNVYQNLAGVLVGGICTVAALLVTVPAGTVYIAGGMVWTNASGETQSVTDNATTYLWGCADGIVRVTSTTTAPPDFEGSLSCLLTKAVALSGAVTLDNSVQQRGRSADTTNRIIGENTGVFAPILHTVPVGFWGVVPSGSQYNVFGKLTNSGKIVIRGKVRVSA